MTSICRRTGVRCGDRLPGEGIVLALDRDRRADIGGEATTPQHAAILAHAVGRVLDVARHSLLQDVGMRRIFSRTASAPRRDRQYRSNDGFTPWAVGIASR